MGLRSVLGTHEATSRGDDRHRSRFGKYFPRLFAYVHSTAQDEARAQEIVAEAFTQTFASHDVADDEEFRIWLFALARRILRSAESAADPDGLDSRERDVVSLLFDAQLTHREVGTLLSISEDMVASTLLKALRKLRATAAPHSARHFLRAS